jgi:separase
VECIKTFPYLKSGFIGRTKDTNLLGVFDTSNATKQLATMVDRVTYLGVCELLLDVTSVSLRSIEFDAPCITGALLERQIDSLEGSRWKDGVQRAVVQLLSDVLAVYGPDMPVRRARVLLKCMEFAYHVGPEAVAGMGTPEGMGSEVERLLSQVGRLYHRARNFLTNMLELESWTGHWACAVLHAIPSFGSPVACSSCSPARGR